MADNITTIIEIVREAGKIMLTADENKAVEEKTSPQDLVTIYDKKVQEFLYERLSKAFPDAAFLGEEGLNEDGRGTGIFIIDPIDGTSNFVKNMQHSVISVGYAENEKLKYGVIYNPYKDEMYSAEAGCGAVLNGSPIHATDEDLAHSIVIFGTSPYDPELWDYTFAAARRMMGNCVDVRRFGSAAYDFMLTASGKVGAYYEARLRPWDFAAGMLIATEAGAVVSNLEGKPITDLTKPTPVVTAGKNCHEKVLQLLRQK